MTDTELGTAVVVLAQRLEDSAKNALPRNLAAQIEAAGDQNLIEALADIALELTPLSKRIEKGVGVLQSVWGLDEAISDEEASDLLAKSVKEYFRRQDS